MQTLRVVLGCLGVAVLASAVGCTPTLPLPRADEDDAAMRGEADVVTADVPVVDTGAVVDAPAVVDAGSPVDVPVAPTDRGPMVVDVPMAVDSGVMGVACPNSIAGNGQPCAVVGDGCGGGGSDGCGALYACTCSAQHRWQCSAQTVACDAGPAPVDVQVAVDVQTPRDVPVVPDVPVATCSFVGTFWFRSPIGTTLYLRMRDNGTWAYAGSTAALDRSSLSGVYTTVGDRISIRETDLSLTGCQANEVGVYQTQFAAGCGSAVLRLVSDSCGLRASLMGGRTFTRFGP